MQNIITSKRLFLFGLIAIASIILALFVLFFRAKDRTFAYVEGEKLYISSPASAPVEIAASVDRILDEESGKVLYLSRITEENVGGEAHGTNLIVADPVTGSGKVIAERIVDAKFSPDGMQIVVQDEDHKVRILALDGKEIAQIGVHGSAPIFSHDGNYVAYHKLADQGEGFRLFEFSPYGIALYNLSTGKEELITDNKDDFQPVGFSADMSRVYFNSGRKYDTSPKGFENHVASLWVVDIKSKQATRLTNVSEEVVRQGMMVPTVDSMALWSSDRTTVISSSNDAESGVWQFDFNTEGGLARAERIAEGTSPRWLVPDKSIVVRTKVDGLGEWKTTNIK